MGKIKNLTIKQTKHKKNTPKTEYIIIGSNNFWYASGLTSLQEAKNEVKEIIKKDKWFADPETGETKDELPNKFYIYKATEVCQIYS